MPDAPNGRARSWRAFARQDRAPRVQVEAQTGGVVELRLYDVIDSWGDPFGVSARDFAKVVDALPDDTTEIRLRINSPGGEATEAVAMVNTLRAHDAKVVAVVDGIAASAASFLAATADETVMMPNSELMVHDAWGLAIGNADDMAAMAALLNHTSDNIASMYADKAGGSLADWRAVMAAETWYSAQESVDAGLADSIAKPTKAQAPANRFDLSVFNYAGREHAPPPRTPVASAAGSTSTTNEGSPAVAFSDEGIDTLRQKLGVTDAEADEATILAALDEALSEQAEPQTPPDKPEIPEGMVLVPADVLAVMKQGAQDGALALQAQRDAARDNAIKAAVHDGRITPASKADWTKRWDSAPTDTATLLDSLPKDMVPLAARGHDGGVGDDPEAAPGWSDKYFNTIPKGA